MTRGREGGRTNRYTRGRRGKERDKRKKRRGERMERGTERVEANIFHLRRLEASLRGFLQRTVYLFFFICVYAYSQVFFFLSACVYRMDMHVYMQVHVHVCVRMLKPAVYTHICPFMQIQVRPTS